MRFILVGSGQLGSRHLQGVLKNPSITEVWVIDEWKSSLELAYQRSSEVPHHAIIHFQDGFSNLPEEVDVCIISGTANVRMDHIKSILKKVKVRFLVLEKILFNSSADFEESKSLFSRYPDMKIWVNHPRRMFKFYQLVENFFNSIENESFFVDIRGNDWGIACNALHYIDLWCFLRNTEVDQIDFFNQNNTIVNSKRTSFIEVHGSIKVDFANGDALQMTSEILPDLKSISISVKGELVEYVIDESESLRLFNKEDGDKLIEGEIEYQSNLSKELIDGLLQHDELPLTTYAEAFSMHQKFVLSAIDWYNFKLNKSESFIPVT